MEMYSINRSDKLRACRVDRGLSRKDLAAAANIKINRYDRAEGGLLMGWFNADEIFRLSKVLDIDLSVLT